MSEVNNWRAELTGQERSIETEKNKSRRKRAEQVAQSLRTNLLQQTDASLGYLYLKATKMASDHDFRSVWQKGALHIDALAHLKQWGAENLYEAYWAAPVPNLTILPPYSFSLRFTFTLAQPYLSKDDNGFYIIDNPIMRDKVFRLPMVRPSSWKGNLRAALRQLQSNSVQQLFGKVNETNNEGHTGRLIFYPTFFTQTGLEIINPHDRKTKVGKNPILFESVPEGATGCFTLLYVPFSRIGQDETETRRQVAEDLVAVAKGINAMMTTYGFGAKTSSGFGIAEDQLSKPGKLTVAVEDESPEEEAALEKLPLSKPEIPAPVRRLRENYPKEDFTLKPKEWRAAHNASKKEHDLYREARDAYSEYEYQERGLVYRREEQAKSRHIDRKSVV